MKIKELFEISDPLGSYSGPDAFSGRDDCQIINISKREGEDRIVFTLKRNSDNTESSAYMTVRSEFNDRKDEIISRVQANKNLIGLTLNQLDNLETGINITETEGRMSIENL